MSTAFADLVDRGGVDIVPGDAEEAWEVQADEWTLAIQGWPLTTAFLAIDEEPIGRVELQAALAAVLGSGHLAAIRLLDGRLDGALRNALLQSGDVLSSMLAGSLADDAEGKGDSGR